MKPATDCILTTSGEELEKVVVYLPKEFLKALSFEVGALTLEIQKEQTRTTAFSEVKTWSATTFEGKKAFQAASNISIREGIEAAKAYLKVEFLKAHPRRVHAGRPKDAEAIALGEILHTGYSQNRLRIVKK